MNDFEQEQLIDIINAIEKHNDLNWGLTLICQPAGWHCELTIDGEWRRRAYLDDIHGMLHLEERITEHEKWAN